MRKWMVWLGCALALGCGDGGGATAFEGIYTATDATENSAGCSEGASVTPDDPFFVVSTRSFFGRSIPVLEGCPSLEVCAEVGASSASLTGVILSTGDDRSGLRGQTTSVFELSGECRGTLRTYVLTGELGVDAELRTEEFSVTVPINSASGECETDDVEAAAGSTCDELSVLRGSYAQAL